MSESQQSTESRLSPTTRRTAERILRLAPAGLRLAYDPRSETFAHTVRLVPDRAGSALRAEGTSLRYTAIAVLGLSVAPAAARESALDGGSLEALLLRLRGPVMAGGDLGAVALSVWATAEALGRIEPAPLARLADAADAADATPTVDLAWMLTAAVAALRLDPADADAARLAESSARRLAEAQGEHGCYPHTVPAGRGGRLRAHVGSFADQVYPLQAFARLASLTGDADALERAERTARRIIGLQGGSGEWWWHYDARTGEVVERYPVYSVHQHAMAPMALFDLARAGGVEHLAPIERGMGWLDRPGAGELVAESHSLVWRKLGRREPRKAVRTISAATTALRPGWHLPGLDAAFPPERIDHECRPYELGWALYAWHPILEEGRIR
ncbi:hypothetical protein [Agromyces lapidis]|uniref:Uncharacterized protein n=1 Tax=Agromyces lapidis TaxID=279574 RepID=A0ABV5SM51_9MICO|nr:hypothetical protein [Agromyces lapidis]